MNYPIFTSAKVGVTQMPGARDHVHLEIWLQSNEFETKSSSDNSCCTLKRGQRHIAVVRIEESSNLAAAGLHAFGKALAGDVLRLHGFADLPGKHFLDCHSLERVKLPFLLEKIIKSGELRDGAGSLLLFHSDLFHLIRADFILYYI